MMRCPRLVKLAFLFLAIYFITVVTVANILFPLFQEEIVPKGTRLSRKQLQDPSYEKDEDVARVGLNKITATSKSSLLNATARETPNMDIIMLSNKEYIKLRSRNKKQRFIKRNGPTELFPNNILGNPCSTATIQEDIKDECLKKTFPIVVTSKEQQEQENFPKHCLPKVVMLPSYPTSGNEIVKQLFALHTGFSYGAVIPREGNLIYDWGGKNKFFTSFRNVCLGNLKIPTRNETALVKTHGNAIQFASLAHIQNNTAPSYVIRLVRNPGDNLIRNLVRWSTQYNNNNKLSKEQFMKKAKQTCKDIISTKHGTALEWAQFHNSWMEASRQIPTLILHYEVMTSLSRVKDEFHSVLDFIGEKSRFAVNYTAAVKEPEYVQGTLFRDACGIDQARLLHEMTKEVTRDMGYSFDYEEGVWSL